MPDRKVSSNTGHTELPPIKSNVSVRLVDGVVVNGVVTEHGQKDGRPTFDFDYYHRTRDGQIIKASKWAWPEMVVQRKLRNAQVNSDTRIAVSTATGSCVMTVGQFVVEYGLPTLDEDDPKCHFQNDTDVTLFKMQLAEQGMATVPGFEIKLAK